MYYNPKHFERLLKRLIARQIKKIEMLMDTSFVQAAWKVSQMHPSPDKEFFFKDHPAISRAVDVILKNLSAKIVEQITVGGADAWELANLNNDKLIEQIVRSIGPGRIPPSALLRWQYATRNLEALAEFQKRKEGGLDLSQKVWHYCKDVKGELELALDLGIGDGKSADALSRAVRKYLHNPDALFRRVRDKETGVLRLSKAAAAYHPGAGVYRSAYKNARRLASTETNMAYRTADNDRRENLDFVLGIEVHLSENHTCLDAKGVPRPFYDICDVLQGKYPKWFKFTGWHPHCRCYVTTILPSREEFLDYLAAMDENGVSSYHFKNEVTELPPQFKKWVADNSDRIEKAQERGTLPYFLADNKGWGNAPTATEEADTVAKTALEKAQERHDARTPEQEQGIKNRWHERAYSQQYANNVIRIASAEIGKSTSDQGAYIQKLIDEINAESDYAKVVEKSKELSDFIKSIRNPIIGDIDLHPGGKDMPNAALVGVTFDTPSKVRYAVKKINKDQIQPWFTGQVGTLDANVNKNANGSTNRFTGAIHLTPDRLQHVMDAFDKIGIGQSQAITDEEAEAMAVYWHEITHNHTHSREYFSLSQTISRQYMEMANEYVARRSLPDFYRALGAGRVPSPKYMDKRDTTAYDDWVVNYIAVINATRINEQEVYRAVIKGLFDGDYTKQKASLVDGLLAGGIKDINGKGVGRAIVGKIVQQCTVRSDPASMLSYLRSIDIIR